MLLGNLYGWPGVNREHVDAATIGKLWCRVEVACAPVLTKKIPMLVLSFLGNGG